MTADRDALEERLMILMRLIAITMTAGAGSILIDDGIDSHALARLDALFAALPVAERQRRASGQPSHEPAIWRVLRTRALYTGRARLTQSSACQVHAGP